MAKGNSKDLAAKDVAKALVTATDRLETGKPFVPGWQEKKKTEIKDLESEIKELMKHPRKNKHLLYFLGRLKEAALG